MLVDIDYILDNCINESFNDMIDEDVRFQIIIKEDEYIDDGLVGRI